MIADRDPAPRLPPPGRARRAIGRLLAAAACLALAGCDGSSQSGGAFVFLTVDLFTLDGTSPVGALSSSLADRNASTVVCAVLRNNLKNPTVTAPTGLDSVLVDSYTVALNRADGGPVPGPFAFGTALTVPAGTVAQGAASGNTGTIALTVVPAQAKNEPPLRPAPALPLNATATVVFYGRDGRGQRVQTTGGVSLVFVASGTDAAATCGGAAASSSTNGGADS